MQRHACSFVRCRFGFLLRRIDCWEWIPRLVSLMKWIAQNSCRLICYAALFCHFLPANTCKGNRWWMGADGRGALTVAPGRPLSPGKPRRPGGPSLPGDPCGPGSPYTHTIKQGVRATHIMVHLYIIILFEFSLMWHIKNVHGCARGRNNTSIINNKNTRKGKSRKLFAKNNQVRLYVLWTSDLNV